MNKITIKIDLENAMVKDADWRTGVITTLDDLIAKLQDGDEPELIVDINGNVVGQLIYE